MVSVEFLRELIQIITEEINIILMLRIYLLPPPSNVMS